MPSEYYKKWRKEHPRLQIYLSREEYEWLKKLAEKEGVSMKELVLEAIRRLRGHVDFNKALDLFIEDPDDFYDRVMERAESKGVEGFEPALFTIPCKYCGEPIVFSHGDNIWPRVRATLRNAFKGWHHVGCGPQSK